jgi:hypothetical protein
LVIPAGELVTVGPVTGEPFPAGLAQVTVAWWSPRTAVGAATVSGTPAGVTAFDAAEVTGPP